MIAPESQPEPKISRRIFKWFSSYSRRYLSHHFNAIRVLNPEPLAIDFQGPLVVFLNHSSWWDPLVCVRMADAYFRHRSSFAPIDAVALRKYPLFQKLGFFGVPQGSVVGIRRLLETGGKILSTPGQMLWLTPQGAFTDCREDPCFRRGLGLLAAQIPTTFIPMAIEYVFWTERKPEVLVAFGEPISADASPKSEPEWTKILEQSLSIAQKRLAKSSRRRTLADWIVLERGRAGINFIYDFWRWLKIRLSGEKYSSQHQPEIKS